MTGTTTASSPPPRPTMGPAVTATHDEASVDTDDLRELPHTPALPRRSTVHVSTAIRDARHSKRLSLNFPILVPSNLEPLQQDSNSPSQYTRSPSNASSHHFASPVATQPLTPPSEVDTEDSPDFLTLIAGQERRVLELREEMQKAELELLNLKKKWAVYEATKKRNELKSKTVKLTSVPHKTAVAVSEDEQQERQKRVEARERRLKGLGIAENESTKVIDGHAKRKSQRVFTGTHTRTLSLLQNPTSTMQATSKTTQPTPGFENGVMQPARASIDSSLDSVAGTEPDDTTFKHPSLSRQNTLQGLVAGKALDQVNFGKTYKDLAKAGRNSMPPGTDVLVKQSKQMYEGVSQGFWSFVEDIRQATVGEEASSEQVPPPKHAVRKKRSQQKVHEHICERHGTPGHEGHAKLKAKDKHKPDKDNFWKEFGLETPQAKHLGNTTSATDGNTAPTKEHDHEYKSSTDSKYPPSLLADLMDVNEDDEAWDNWPADSPVARRKSGAAVELARNSISFDEPVEDDRKNVTEQIKPPLHPHPSWAELTS